MSNFLIFNKKLKIALVVFLFFFLIWTHFTLWPQLFSGNFTLFILFGKNFYLNKSLILSHFTEGVTVLANFHTTLYIHIISWVYEIVGDDLRLFKLLNILITLIGIFFILAKTYNKNRYKTVLALLLWLSLPIVTNSVHITDPDSNLGWLIVLLIYLNLDKFFSAKIISRYSFAMIFLVFIMIWTKETTALLVSIAFITSAIVTSREKFFESTGIIFFSWTLFLLTYIIYCDAYNINALNIISSFLYHSMGPQDLSNIFFKVLYATKGFFIWIGSGFVLFIFFDLINRIKHREFSAQYIFIITLTALGVTMLFLSGLYYPRYIIACLLPLILEVYKSTGNEQSIDYPMLLLALLYAFLCVFVIQDPVLTYKNMFDSNIKLFIVLILMMAPFLLTLAYILIGKILNIGKVNIISLVISFTLIHSISSNFYMSSGGYATYGNGHGMVGFSDSINFIKKNYDNKKRIISNHIDISLYLDNPVKHIYHIGYDVPISNKINLPKNVDMKDLVNFSEGKDLLYISNGDVFFKNFLKDNSDFMNLLYQKENYSIYNLNIKKIRERH